MATSTSTKNMMRPDGYDLGRRASSTMVHDKSTAAGGVSTTSGGGGGGNGVMYETHMVLPPFESRFVSVGFTPTSMQRFDARFVAVV